MAGIGFTLRKVISKGQISTSLQAAVSGILIVAGPWILSIITLSIINRYMSVVLTGFSNLFIAQLVYTYSTSLILFSPVQMLFTRMLSDLIWEKREREAGSLVLWFLGLSLIGSIAISVPVMLLIPLEGIEHVLMYRLAAILFYAAINMMWIMLLFTSLIHWYKRILAVISTGMAVALALVWVMGTSSGIAGALMGFALGHMGIVILLLVMGLVKYPPAYKKGMLKEVKSYLHRYVHLLAAGTFLNAGIWADKIIYWFTRGSAVDQAPYMIFAPYDISVYYANLMMIPGLVYFVIFGETGFYTYLSRFLNSLLKSSYARIQKAKTEMQQSMRRELRNQQVFQGGIILVAILLAPSIFSGAYTPIVPLFFQITVIGVFLQLFLITIINYTYYFELYREAMIAAAIFAVLNTVFTLIQELALPATPPGIPLILATGIASMQAYLILNRRAARMDRIILTQDY